MSVAWKGEARELTVTAEQFADGAGVLIERLRVPVLRALRDSRIPSNDLAEIVLVGGATRMPVVRKAVTKMFGRFPASQVHPDEAVALGAAVQAGLKARDSALREVVLTDVCPYTLGVDTAERLPNGLLRQGLFAPIIERNTVVPASRERVFSPLQDGQRTVEFRIFQGESPNVADNIELGKIAVPLPANSRMDQTQVACRFTYDINGLLEVDVFVPQSGERRQLVIMDKEAPMEPADIERRRGELAQLKVHPREHDANRALAARGERCYEAMLGDRREHVGRCLQQFVTAVESQDPRTIEAAREQFTKVLDTLEGETFL